MEISSSGQAVAAPAGAQSPPGWSARKLPDFAAPTAAPATAAQHDEWQNANRAWWEQHPMRYDWRRPLEGMAGEREWYREMDRRLFQAAVLPPAAGPFGALLPREALAGKSVLEVGVGMGAHAQILAAAAGRFVGIDLTRGAVAATMRRLELACLSRGTLLQMDAENLAFPDASFDLVWSWGVIHHSASTRRALEEIRRVLKPDGRALIMVYHRAAVPWLLYAGIIRGGLVRRGGIHHVVQGSTDGALARYYTVAEWRKEIAGLFAADVTETYGNRGEFLPLPAGRLKDWLTRRIPEALMRLWLTQCGQGTLLFSRLRPEF